MESVGGSTIFSTTKLKDLVTGAFSGAAAAPEGFGAGMSGDMIANSIRLPTYSHGTANQTGKEMDAQDFFKVLSQASSTMTLAFLG